MYLMEALPKSVGLILLFAVMLSAGARTTVADVRLLVSREGLFQRSLVANFVLVPLIGVLMVRCLPMSDDAKCALLLLACTPGGISAVQFMPRKKAAATYGAVLSVFLSSIAIFASPAILGLFVPGWAKVEVPYVGLIAFVVMFEYLPFALGLLAHQRAPHMSSRLIVACDAIAGGLYLTLPILVLIKQRSVIFASGPDMGVHISIFILLSMAVGWTLAGADREERTVLATVTGMRQLGLCLLMAVATPGYVRVLDWLVAFTALMVAPNVLLTVWGMMRPPVPRERRSVAHHVTAAITRARGRARTP